MVFRKHTWVKYKKLVGECSNLSCAHYTYLEAHHIVPLAAGGSDEFDNIIVLCRDCHMGNHNHAEWMIHYDKLHAWKDVVDSHIVYDYLNGEWINSDPRNEDAVRDIKDDEYFVSDDDEMVHWQDTSVLAFCYNCGERKHTFKFGKGFFCEDCINTYINTLPEARREEMLSLKVSAKNMSVEKRRSKDKFEFVPRVFPELFR